MIIALRTKRQAGTQISETLTQGRLVGLFTIHLQIPYFGMFLRYLPTQIRGIP